MYTANDLNDIETISQGHTDDLKVEEDNIRIWLSRMTVADGMPYDNQITIEMYMLNKWVIINQYEG